MDKGNLNWDLAPALEFEAYALSVTMRSEDIQEGLKAFVEKREPAGGHWPPDEVP